MERRKLDLATMSKDSTTRPKSTANAPEECGEIVQEHPQDAPAGWVTAQNSMAESTGLSVLLVDGLQPPALAVSNNNSICHAFQSSAEYVKLCDPYCGDAHRRAMSAGTRVDYKCHAGLECFTMPVEIGKPNLAVIGGRSFATAADYKALMDRFRAGELNDLLNCEPFQNIIFAEKEKLDQLAARVGKAQRTFGAPADRASETNVTRPSTPSELDLALEQLASEHLGSVQPETLPSSSDLQEEIERLRGELEYRSQVAQSLQGFLQRINSTDPAKTYRAILTHVAELVQAQRTSLWVFNDASNQVLLRDSIGLPLDQQIGPVALGEGPLGSVAESSQPLLVPDILQSEWRAAPAERHYQTRSCLIYPIVISGRLIGVVNIADKRDGGSFTDVDLTLLEIVGPQIAVALERAEWQQRAQQFQLMSITDPLTGLLNRRYLEERLTEELTRSKRYNYSMSCLMIDIDDFKTYNDRNGHQEGDLALKITAHSVKAALRSEDIACRYGGEEFCILLPQTTASEALVIAERVRQRVAEADYPHGKSQPLGRVSISIGISTLASNVDTAERVISAADRALYVAKHKGKDRIEFYSDDLTTTITA